MSVCHFSALLFYTSYFGRRSSMFNFNCLSNICPLIGQQAILVLPPSDWSIASYEFDEQITKIYSGEFQPVLDGLMMIFSNWRSIKSFWFLFIPSNKQSFIQDSPRYLNCPL